MVISEQGLPNVAGKWCGQGSGYSIYYSETYSISLELNIYKIYSHMINPGFEFNIRYKFLRAVDAKLR